MAIRLRQVNNKLVALCAYETDYMSGDVYLDDIQHEALAAKFWRDYQGKTIDWSDKESDHLAETQKLRSATEDCAKLQEQTMSDEEKIKMYEEVLVDIRDGYDHDEDAHKYGTHCRKCMAELALLGRDPWGRNET